MNTLIKQLSFFSAYLRLCLCLIIIIIYPLTARVVGEAQMISQSVSSIPCLSLCFSQLCLCLCLSLYLSDLVKPMSFTRYLPMNNLVLFTRTYKWFMTARPISVQFQGQNGVWKMYFQDEMDDPDPDDSKKRAATRTFVRTTSCVLRFLLMTVLWCNTTPRFKLLTSFACFLWFLTVENSAVTNKRFAVCWAR